MTVYDEGLYNQSPMISVLTVPVTYYFDGWAGQNSYTSNADLVTFFVFKM